MKCILPANDDQLFDKDGDSSDHSKQISGKHFISL